jgi:hypothetical protein
MLNYSAREIVAEAMRVMLLRHAKSKKAQRKCGRHVQTRRNRHHSHSPDGRETEARFR